jgi:hypothetical protein
MNKIRLGSDNLIALNGPVDNSTGAVVGTSPTSCKARIYNERKETQVRTFATRLTAAALSGDSAVKVPLLSPDPIVSGDTVRVTLDDGSVKEAALSGSANSTGYQTLTFATTLGVAAATGNLVEVVTKVASATVFPIRADTLLEVGDQVEIRQDDGQSLTTTIIQLQKVVATEDASDLAPTAAKNQPTFFAITVAAGRAQATTAGARLRVKLGDDVSSLASFGSFPTSNPVAGDTAWGFRGAIPDDQAGLKAGQDVRVEIEYNGGAGLQLVTSIMAKIVDETT